MKQLRNVKRNCRGIKAIIKNKETTSDKKKIKILVPWSIYTHMREKKKGKTPKFLK